MPLESRGGHVLCGVPAGATEGRFTVGALHRFEQRLEHMVTGAFARAFRSAVQPMEIAAALEREADNSAQILSRDRRLSPNDFTIDLSANDYDRLSTYGQTLSNELAAMLHEHAQQQNYLFAGPLRMNFQRVEDLTTGRFRVRSAASAEVTPAPGHAATETAVRRADAFLEIGASRHPLEPPGLVIGRGSQADLRIDDPGVSRRHVEFRVQTDRDGLTVSLVDLGSTNGTTVDGHRVQHALLSDGAVVQIGGTRIVVRVGGQSGPSPEEPPYAGRAPKPSQPQPYQPQPYQPQPYQPGRAPAPGGTDQHRSG